MRIDFRLTLSEAGRLTLPLFYGGRVNNLFLENGYVDMARIIEQKYPFILMTGARGTGKTYGALKYVIEHKMKFIYMLVVFRVLLILQVIYLKIKKQF